MTLFYRVLYYFSDLSGKFDNINLQNEIILKNAAFCPQQARINPSVVHSSYCMESLWRGTIVVFGARNAQKTDCLRPRLEHLLVLIFWGNYLPLFSKPQSEIYESGGHLASILLFIQMTKWINSWKVLGQDLWHIKNSIKVNYYYTSIWIPDWKWSCLGKWVLYMFSKFAFFVLIQILS